MNHKYQIVIEILYNSNDSDYIGKFHKIECIPTHLQYPAYPFGDNSPQTASSIPVFVSFWTWTGQRVFDGSLGSILYSILLVYMSLNDWKFY